MKIKTTAPSNNQLAEQARANPVFLAKHEDLAVVWQGVAGRGRAWQGVAGCSSPWVSSCCKLLSQCRGSKRGGARGSHCLPMAGQQEGKEVTC